jgi:hypothetical protein
MRYLAMDIYANHIENTSCDTSSIVACACFGRCLEMRLRVAILLHEETWTLTFLRLTFLNPRVEKILWEMRQLYNAVYIRKVVFLPRYPFIKMYRGLYK